MKTRTTIKKINLIHYFSRINLSSVILILILCSLIAPGVKAEKVALAKLPSFPGAEGFGAVAVGGRGGQVVKVINLKSEGPGSLQAACEADGPRIVIFEVAGVIRGDIAIKHPYITIAGQTAPSPGITIEGRLLARPIDKSRLHDIVIRFLRIRPLRATGHIGDAIQLPNTERVMLDHLSLSWATDELIDICHSSEFTIQWCTLEESDPEGHDKGVPHNFAIISAYPESGNISIHHNLFAHHSKRSPSLSPYVPGKPGDFRNNVVYNFHEGLTHDGHTPQAPVNFIGNYYKRGPSSRIINPFVFHRAGQYYLEGNVIEGIGEINYPLKWNSSFPSWLKYSRKWEKLLQPASVAIVTTQKAKEAYNMVLATAGTFPRDRVTKRTIEEVSKGTGKWGRNAPVYPPDEWYFEGLLKSKSPIDTDEDGIPDAWENRRNLNKHDPLDYNKLMPSGYSAMEEYLNEQAEALTKDRKDGIH
jgi:pectate lyase